MFCIECGGKLSSDSLFCSSCGTRVEKTNSFEEHNKDYDHNKKSLLHEKYQNEVDELLAKGYSKLEAVPPIWNFLWKIGIDIKPPPLLSSVQIGLFCGGGFAFLFFISDLFQYYLINGHIKSFGIYLFMGIAFGVLTMAVSWFRNQKLNGKFEKPNPTNLPLNQQSKDRFFTLFGILDNGALKKKAIEERSNVILEITGGYSVGKSGPLGWIFKMIDNTSYKIVVVYPNVSLEKIEKSISWEKSRYNSSISRFFFLRNSMDHYLYLL